MLIAAIVRKLRSGVVHVQRGRARTAPGAPGDDAYGAAEAVLWDGGDAILWAAGDTMTWEY